MNNPVARVKRNKDLKKEIVALYKLGYSYREIAKTLEISHEWARKLHLSTTINEVSLTDIDKAASLISKEAEAS